jgi:hypothetical protein
MFLIACGETDFGSRTGSGFNDKQLNAKSEDGSEVTDDDSSVDDSDSGDDDDNDDSSDSGSNNPRSPINSGVDEVGVDGQPIGGGDQTGAGSSGGKLVTRSTTFKLAKQSGLVDLVWVIDNSGSMANESDIVTRNLDGFVNRIKGKAGLKMTLISKAGKGGQSVNLSATAIAAGHSQINVEIDSNNAMTAAALASCSSGSNKSGSNGTICGVPSRSSFSGTSFAKLSGALVNSFRKDAKRVYVFVTDDVATNVTDQNFMTIVQKETAAKITAFGFVALAKVSGCNITKIGTPYINLANQTGGKTFEICAGDWSPHFDTLASSVVALANEDMPMPDPGVKRIVSVKVDGETVNKADYSLRDNTLVLDRSKLPADATDLVVTYEIVQ